MTIQLILGPVGSGKTTELMRRLGRYRLYGSRDVICVGHAEDTRGATHDGVRVARDVRAARLGDVLVPDPARSVIGVDEGQFFPDLVEAAVRWSDAGAVVVVAALNANSARERFDAADPAELTRYAVEIRLLDAVCCVDGCEVPAYRSARVDGREDRSAIDVGGGDKFRAVCDAHWLARRGSKQRYG